MGAQLKLGIGERTPDFVLVGPSGPVRFYAIAGGRPVAVVLGDATGVRGKEIRALLGDRGDVDVVSLDPDVAAEVFGADRDVSTVVVLDANLRVAGELAAERPAVDIVAVLDDLLPTERPREVSHQAPVLFVPRVLDPHQRRRLMDTWTQRGELATGVERAAEGTRSPQLDDSFKRRRDHTVDDPDMVRELSSSVGRRVMPEVHKAFGFRANRFEGFKIGCYDATTGGFFRPHRDNLSPTTAHRVFALTLNLNEDYEGGQLRFPEYGNDLYRPAAGAALIFSCSHLHEVRDVTEGRRFVLLSFLYAARPTPAVP